MGDRRFSEPRVLTESEATRLLQRASELDAARSAHLQLAELRAAATQAGISAGAFDAALEEMQRDEQPVSMEAVERRPPRRPWRTVVGIAAVLGMLGMFGSMVVVPASAEPAVEEVFLLRCLSPGEARAVLSPIFARGGAIYGPADARRVLVVRGSPAQVDRARAVLEKLESEGSTACAVRPGSGTSR